MNETLPTEVPSVLGTIRKKLGAEEDYTHFDADILTIINASFLTLYQLGLEKDKGIIRIEDETTTWEDVIDVERYSWVKDYIAICVRLVFDPPSSSFVMDMLKATKDEYEWRLWIQKDMEGSDIL